MNGAQVPTVAVPTKVSDFPHIESRLNEAIDMLRNVDQTVIAIKGKLIGHEVSDEVEKAPTPEPATFVDRANRSLDCIQELLRSVNITLNDLNAQT